MLVLASASPRRRQLLSQVGYIFDVIPAHINEDVRPGEEPLPYVKRLAREKAEAIFASLANPKAVVLGADTTVTLDGTILGKPESPADAARILSLLSGRTHQVITGVAVVASGGTQVAAETTGVQFSALSQKDIASYIATGEPMDKAGAYGIQGRAARWIPRIEGCYFNVVGLPLSLVSTLLASAEVHP
ncbi:MAG: septum formation inhibitor Maf [Acidobacteriota bacterium]|nr:septum formation inhibitor Maf [Acidobacteriota bacterium]